MSSLNKIILIGNLTENPEQKATNSGDSFARFTMAVDRPSYGDSGQHGTDFIQVVAWRNAAEKTHALLKGQPVMVEGRIITRTYDDNDGKRHYITEVDAKEVMAMTGQTKQFVDSVDVQHMPQESSVTPVSTPAPVAAPVVPDTSLEIKPVSDSVPDFDFGSVPAHLSEEVEEDIPF